MCTRWVNATEKIKTKTPNHQVLQITLYKTHSSHIKNKHLWTKAAAFVIVKLTQPFQEDWS